LQSCYKPVLALVLLCVFFLQTIPSRLASAGTLVLRSGEGRMTLVSVVESEQPMAIFACISVDESEQEAITIACLLYVQIPL
jgi:hypothetical protein